jgi:hypothetical protein
MSMNVILGRHSRPGPDANPHRPAAAEHGTYSHAVVDGDARDGLVRETLRNVGATQPPGADHYLGLSRTEAERFATSEGRRVVDRTPDFESRRADLVTRRINLLLDSAGVVIRADIG